MEQETKYRIDSSRTAECIEKDVLSEIYAKILMQDTVKLDADYYDTEDGRLKKAGVAIRTRKENDDTFITIKWGEIKTRAGLHEHEELNIEVNREDILTGLPIDKVISLIPEELRFLFENGDFKTIVSTSVTRRRFEIKYKNCTAELALDKGLVSADGNSTPISEIEIELTEGELGDVIELSRIIAEKYDLKPEEKSKYARGLELYTAGKRI